MGDDVNFYVITYEDGFELIVRADSILNIQYYYFIDWAKVVSVTLIGEAKRLIPDNRNQ